MEMGQVYDEKCTLGATDVTLPKTLLAEGLDYSGTVHELKFNYLHMRRPRILPESWNPLFNSAFMDIR
jgi:hypothetical protein